MRQPLIAAFWVAAVCCTPATAAGGALLLFAGDFFHPGLTVLDVTAQPRP